jgi:diguanylate cyclase (GGDEF)-like protein/PAS domain S-box-containing protein
VTDRFDAPVDGHAVDPAGDDEQGRYDDLLRHLPGVVYVESAHEDRFLDVSDGIERLLGFPAEEWRANRRLWRDVIHPDDAARIEVANAECEATGAPFEETYRAVARDGRVVHVMERSVLVRDDGGEPRYWLGAMLDVTELVSAEHRLSEANAKYGALVEQIPAIVYVDVADESWLTTYVSPQIERILGISADRYMQDAHLWESMLHPDDRERAVEAYVRGRESGEPFSLEYRLVAHDGRVVWFQDSAVVLHGPDGRPAWIQGVMLDVTERKAVEERLTFLAYHDALTGLPNKAMFDELLELSLARARRHGSGVAVLALDVDNFKLVNDSLGHEVGDQLLIQLADRLREATRETDLIARQGGDEFLLLIADIDREDAGERGMGVTGSVAGRVQGALAAPFEVGGTELYLTASIGISTFPDDADDAGELLRNADTAMFRSKGGGPGGFLAHQADDMEAITKLSLSTRLRKAVEQKAWTLHYQPLVELGSGDMVGVEALIRWPDPNGGLVPPGEFIPLAEEMGLIEAIGDWVVGELCRQDEEWRANGMELEMSFNLSPRELWHADPVERIASHVLAAGMDPTRLTVEITESTAMHDPDRIIDVLQRFHDQGIRLAIDDFGTGYSSLSRLRYMPVDVLKIDRTFVRDVHSDPQSASMVSAIVALATNLGMQPLAEGIETEAEWRFLAERGCALGQGYFFSKPVAPEQILAMYRRSRLNVVDGGLAG